ncbi:MAG: DNA-3-methyladenine glycosylase I [Bacillota bacterium]
MTEKIRCGWSGDDPMYREYHDKEWGVPVYEDRKLFEFLLLESAQAGLSWITILKRRGNYREAFDNFDPHKIAEYDEEKIEILKKNSGIIRNKLKIESAVNNARRFLEIQADHGSFSSYIWNFTGGRQITNNYHTLEEVPAHTELSEKISADMKEKGFKFIGPTIIYAYMQAVGIVNDHLVHCFRHQEIYDRGGY